MLLIATWMWAGPPTTPPGPWDAGYEGDPVTGDPVAEGDDWLRALKTDLRERLEVEHHFSDITTGDAGADSNDNGLHRIGSARCFFQDAAPTQIELRQHDNSGTSDAGDDLLTDSAINDGGSELVGDGRCWIDVDGADNIDDTADDNQLHFYNGATGWEAVRAVGQTPTGVGGNNLLYNGDFEIQGDGSTTNPTGWTEVDGGTGSGGPTVTYNDNTGTDRSEGTGLSFEVTADADADGSDEFTQTLTGLKASTKYLVIARVKPGDGHQCLLNTDAATEANLPDGTATTGTSRPFETLVGTFTTDSTPTAVVVELENDPDTASSVCTWDHVGVFEIQTGDPVPSSRGFLWYSTSTSTESESLASTGYVTFSDMTSPTFEVPSDNCYATAEWKFGWATTDNNDGGADDIYEFYFTLRSNVAGAGFSDLEVCRSEETDSDADAALVHSCYYNKTDSTPMGTDENQFFTLTATQTGLRGGDSLIFALAANIVDDGTSNDSIDLDPTIPLDTGTRSTPHHMTVEMVCH